MGTFRILGIWNFLDFKFYRNNSLPVQRDSKKICNAGCAGHDIGCNPELTKASTKTPRSADIVYQGERHDHRGNEEISQSH